MSTRMTRGEWLRWGLGFAAFPLGGLLGRAAAGPVDDVTAALVGGVVTGAVIGLAQGLLASSRLPVAAWTTVTAVGSAVGLAAGGALVDWQTDAGSLAVVGLATGLAVGAGQGAALRAASPRVRFAWAAAAPVVWALGWLTTTAAGVDVERQYTVFGATGALVVTAALGLLLRALVPPRRVTALAAPGRGTVTS